MQSPMLNRNVVASRCNGKVAQTFYRSGLACRGSAAAQASSVRASAVKSDEVRVRFAPSPTGNLHVGGARTALFNWLYAKKMGGKFILRVEDTDTARSTRASEEAMIRDLTWLGLTWDEGPDREGPYGPYRQSERTSIYKENVDKLVAEGKAYPCFCTDEEIDAMKKEAEELKIPPIYRGKWARASAEEVTAMKATGAPFCYRFRVPKNQDITIQDMIRGSVTWNTDSLGDFVLLRSSGQPVYNFCVAIDDALMRITHVIRAEEHLSNTLRQVLIYNALAFKQPFFGHVSLILAPDKSKLSKRHGATSVGEFQNQGFLAPAMINFLSLLGWNDGTEQEIYTVEELSSKFGLDRITKSPAVFDKVKLEWMNGQYLKALPQEEVFPLVSRSLVAAGLITTTDSPFAVAVTKLVSKNLELIPDAEVELRKLLAYPFQATLVTEDAVPLVADNMKEVVDALLAAYDSGELKTAVDGGADVFKKWINSVGKAQKRKGKRLFMPMRIALTGRMEGSDLGDQLAMLMLEQGDVVDPAAVQFVTLGQRLESLREWSAQQPAFVAPVAV